MTTPTTDYAPLYQAVAALAGVCDYAESLDGQGFNGPDAYLGHALADMGEAAWTEDLALTAWDMIRKYKNTQLAEAGIDYDAIPLPPGAEELLDERRQQAREAAKERIREHRAAKARREKSFILCDGEDEEVVLGFVAPSSDFWTMVGDSKAITGRAFRREYRGLRDVNVYPYLSLPAVVDFADKWDIPVTAEVRALVAIAKGKYAAALQEAEKAAAEKAALPQVRLDDTGRIVIDREWDSDTKRLNDALRGLNRGYSTWNKAAGMHHPPYRDPEPLLKVIGDFGLTISPEAQKLLDDEIALQERNLIESMASSADPIEIPGLVEGFELRPVQYAGVRWLVRQRRTWDGDGMGFGKSITTLAAVAVENAYPLVIVCLPNLTLNWVNELKRFPYVNVFVAEGQEAKPIPRDTDVVIIGSAVLAHTKDKRKGRDIERDFPWVKSISRLQPKALILDEGQMAKEWTSNRTQAVKQLSAPIIDRNGLVLNASGTPAMNRPKELTPQLEAMGRIEEFGGTGAFLVRYCEDEEKSTQWGRNFDGAKNLDELHDKLRRYGILLRRTDPALLGLKPCNEHVLEVSLDELDPKVMAEYVEAERDVVTFLADKAMKLAKKYGVDPEHARVRAAMKAQAAEHLVLLNTLRGLVGRAKIGYAERWAQAQVAKGEKVMLAAHHQDVTKPLAKKFGGLQIVGGQTVKSKEADKYAFQNNPNAKVITVAIEAGGMGHTLTAARLGMQVEYPWTPGAKNQMKMRLHRIGQEREVDYYLLTAKDTIDEHMRSVLERKQQWMEEMFDGKRPLGVDMDEGSIVAEVAWRLAQQGFGGRA